jgi:trans-2,3-dihydro-3-hydroxyanthranilate isomerase
MRLSYVLVDVFTDTPLRGNAVAVFDEGPALTGDQMQRLAREMNLSETVFLLPPERGGDARLRIFTPTTELPFAGHPVLGTAFVVGAALQSAKIQLETPAAMVPLELEIDGEQVTFARMRQPVPTWEPYPRAADMLAALGVAESGLPIEAYQNGPLHVYVALPDEAAVAAVKPDFAALAQLAGVGANCFAGSGGRWRTRMFAPALGVAEDPATGSAAGPLAVHLARHGRIGFGEEIEIHQGAEVARPSVIYARADGSPADIEAVYVSGAAVIVARGEFSRW